MSVRADVEEIETTKAEKLLAVVLAVFMLVGGIWLYQRIDDWTRTSHGYALTPAEQAAVSASANAHSQLSAAATNAAQARQDLELKREAYRTALEAHQPAERLRVQYVAAQAELKAALRQAGGGAAEGAAARAGGGAGAGGGLAPRRPQRPPRRPVVGAPAAAVRARVARRRPRVAGAPAQAPLALRADDVRGRRRRRGARAPVRRRLRRRLHLVAADGPARACPSRASPRPWPCSRSSSATCGGSRRCAGSAATAARSAAIRCRATSTARAAGATSSASARRAASPAASARASAAPAARLRRRYGWRRPPARRAALRQVVAAGVPSVSVCPTLRLG